MTLPLPGVAGAVGGGASSTGGNKPLALPEGGEVDVCYLVNTAEYCADTVPQVGFLCLMGVVVCVCVPRVGRVRPHTAVSVEKKGGREPGPPQISHRR